MSGTLWQSQVGHPPACPDLSHSGPVAQSEEVWGLAVATVSEIISAMREAAPAGQEMLDDRVLGELSSLTQALMAARPDAGEECARFLALGQREIAVPEAIWPRGSAARRSW